MTKYYFRLAQILRGVKNHFVRIISIRAPVEIYIEYFERWEKDIQRYISLVRESYELIEKVNEFIPVGPFKLTSDEMEELYLVLEDHCEEILNCSDAVKI